MKVSGIAANLDKNNMSSKVIYLSIISVILIFCVFINPDKVSLSTCTFKELTGHNCFTCGLSRSLFAVSHFRIIESFRFHLMGPFIFFFMLFFFVKISFEVITGKEILLKINSTVTKMCVFLFFFAWMIFWIIRFISEG